MAADLGQIQNWLGQEYTNPGVGKELVSSASTQINNLTRKRVRDLLSKYSTTGMGRSGISGAATNDIYSGAGENLVDASAKGAELDASHRMQALGEMGNIAQYEDSKPTFMDFAGSLLGQAGGIAGGMGLSKLFGFGGAGKGV